MPNHLKDLLDAQKGLAEMADALKDRLESPLAKMTAGLAETAENNFGPPVARFAPNPNVSLPPPDHCDRCGQTIASQHCPEGHRTYLLQGDSVLGTSRPMEYQCDACRATYELVGGRLANPLPNAP